jgi:hypothetical protein
MTLLCNGDIDRPIRIEVLDWDKNGKHAFMGQVDTSVRGLLDSNGAAMNVIIPRTQAKKGDRYLNDGVLHATYTYIEDNPTFADVRQCVAAALIVHFFLSSAITTLWHTHHVVSLPSSCLPSFLFPFHMHLRAFAPVRAVCGGRAAHLSGGGHRLHGQQRRPAEPRLASLQQVRPCYS